jgi:adenine-specific DNA-methyltransferase
MQSQIDLSLTIEYNSETQLESPNRQWLGWFFHLFRTQNNQTFIDKILEAKDSKTLFGIWEQMKKKSFELQYRFQKQEEHRRLQKIRIFGTTRTFDCFVG